MTADRITLTGLRATAFHGVFDNERADGQEFVIDVTVYLSLRDAAATDDAGRRPCTTASWPNASSRRSSPTRST